MMWNNVMMNTDGERDGESGSVRNPHSDCIVEQEQTDANVKGCDNDSLTHLIYDLILYLRATNHSNERYIIFFLPSLPTFFFLLIYLPME